MSVCLLERVTSPVTNARPGSALIAEITRTSGFGNRPRLRSVPLPGERSYARMLVLFCVCGFSLAATRKMFVLGLTSRPHEKKPGSCVWCTILPDAVRPSTRPLPSLLMIVLLSSSYTRLKTRSLWPANDSFGSRPTMRPERTAPLLNGVRAGVPDTTAAGTIGVGRPVGVVKGDADALPIMLADAIRPPMDPSEMNGVTLTPSCTPCDARFWRMYETSYCSTLSLTWRSAASSSAQWASVHFSLSATPLCSISLPSAVTAAQRISCLGIMLMIVLSMTSTLIRLSRASIANVSVRAKKSSRSLSTGRGRPSCCTMCSTSLLRKLKPYGCTSCGITAT
eukprot:Unigene6393_Nuclearia_a/m.19700 Unigene6393_Nuclearia_a/g.19700  ORF Unigene6393_Nuclearia_a/g.19700 Unigene6393_Nuclearia_a/m.19700 type:complete len:338 (+) Unigene6393_Nuclearia_a:558-1571(+)